MALWDLDNDDFLSKKREERGPIATSKVKKTSTRKKSTMERPARGAKIKSPKIKNACIAAIGALILLFFVTGSKGCVSSNILLPAAFPSSILAPLDWLFPESSSSKDSSSYRSIDYVTDVEMKTDLYLVRGNLPQPKLTFVCLYQIPEMDTAQDYIYAMVNAKLKYRDKSSDPFTECWTPYLMHTDYYMYYGKDDYVKKILEINCEGWRRSDYNKPLIGFSATDDTEYVVGLDAVEGREYAISILDEQYKEKKLIEGVTLHEVTYPEMNDIIKGWVTEFGLAEKTKYDN